MPPMLRLACLITAITTPAAAVPTTCSCANQVPNAQSVDFLEDAFAKRVAGRRRTKQAVLAAVRQQASAAQSGRAAPLRLHFTGPSGAGKSFLAQLIATAKFEESRRYTGYASVGAAGATAASITAGAVAGHVSTWSAVVALASSPLAVAGGVLGLLSAALFGWQAGDLADAYWGTTPAPYPTQCGVAWWKFAAFSDEQEAITDARGAVRAAALAVAECSGAVVVLEDVNRLPPAALRALEPLTQPLLRSGDVAAPTAQATIIFTSDLYTGPDAADAGVLEPGMALADAQHVASRQARKMWGGAAPAWWARDVATFALPPLDARELEGAVELYLSHDVGAALRDELRFRFESMRRAAPDTRHEWTGSFSYEEEVVDAVRGFLDEGPAEWRCHGITHFRHRVLEPEFGRAAELLLERSRSYVHSHGWARLHEQVARTVVYTSSLLLKAALNADGTVDVGWELLHLPHDRGHEEAAEPSYAEAVVGGLARFVAWASSSPA